MKIHKTRFYFLIGLVMVAVMFHSNSEVHANTEWKAMKANDVVTSTKEWKVSLNTAIDPKTVTRQSVYVENADGKRMETTNHVLHKHKSILVSAPSDGYPAGQYTLKVTRSIENPSGDQLKQPVSFTFKVKDYSAEELLKNAVKAHEDIQQYGFSFVITEWLTQNGQKQKDFVEYIGDIDLETSESRIKVGQLGGSVEIYSNPQNSYIRRLYNGPWYKMSEDNQTSNPFTRDFSFSKDLERSIPLSPYFEVSEKKTVFILTLDYNQDNAQEIVDIFTEHMPESTGEPQMELRDLDYELRISKDTYNLSEVNLKKDMVMDNGEEQLSYIQEIEASYGSFNEKPHHPGFPSQDTLDQAPLLPTE